MENRTSFLDLDEDCKRKILKYIIADCELKGKSHGNKMKYLNLVRFALAHDDLEALLEEYYNDLYKDIEFLFVANRFYLCIDFAQLQSIHTGKAGDAFWRFFTDALRENSVIAEVKLLYSPQSFQPDFLDNFQMIKRALENKESLDRVLIDITGYSLDDLNNFGHITQLDLNVRVSAEDLATICKSNPHLTELSIMSTDIFGRLSDIVPHCRNLKELKFVQKPDVDIAEYAPLAQLPNLSEMTIHGAFKNGSVLTTFEAIQKWQKPESEYLDIVFADDLPALSSVTLPRKDLLKTLSINSKIDSHSDSDSVLLEASYNYLKLTANIDRAEELYATFTLIEGVHFSVKHGDRNLFLRFLASRATELASLIKVFNINTLFLQCLKENSQAHLVKLFGLLHPEGSFALRKLDIEGQALDQFGTSELVKIQSLQKLYCTFSDWESFDHLSKLTNLQEIVISARKEVDLFVSNGVRRLSLKRYMASMACKVCKLSNLQEIEVDLFVSNGVRRLSLKRYIASMASELASLIKVLNVDTLDLHCSEENSQALLVKLFGLLHPDGSFALRKLRILGPWFGTLDQFGTSELVKIQSLQDMECTFTDWESFEHLIKLTNLQEIEICVIEQLDERSLQALCNFLNNCHGNLNGTIICSINGDFNWKIVLREKEISLGTVALNSDSDEKNLLRRKLLTYLQNKFRKYLEY